MLQCSTHIHTKEKNMSEENNADHGTFKGLPEVKFNKNGYEIRTEVVAMAKDFVAQELQYKWMGWEMTTKRDETGRIVSRVDMPDLPNLDYLLATAEKMYNFIQGKK